MRSTVDLLLQQIKAVEAERDAMQEAAMEATTSEAATTAAQLLLRLRAVGPQTAAVLVLEAFYRHFDNRRQVAAFAGLSPSPWQSGAVVHDQGISKAGQPQLRKTMVELAGGRRRQPGSALSRWFAERARGQDARRRRALIVALARKSPVARALRTTASFRRETAFKAA